MVSLDATVIVAAFPALRACFAGSSPATLSWTINGYTIVYAALLVPLGRRVDGGGYRRSFLTGIAGFTLASALCAFAPSAPWLIGARLLQAVAAALLAPASLALILAAFPPGERSRSAGLWSAVGALAAALGPVIGSLLIDAFSWRMIFLINIPIGLVVWALGRRRLKPNAPVRAGLKFDRIGTLLLVSGVGMVAAGLSRMGDPEASQSASAAQVLIGVVLLAGLMRRTHVRDDRDSGLNLLAMPRYRWASLATLLLGMSFGMMFLAFYLLFTGVWRYSLSIAGLAATPGPLVATLVAVVISGRLVTWGLLRPMLAGGLLFFLSNAWLALRIGAEPEYLATWLPGQILGGIAVGLLLPSIAGAAVSCLPASQLGVGSALNNAIRQLGSAIGVALAVAFAGYEMHRAESFPPLYWSLALCGLLIAGVSLRASEDRHSRSGDPGAQGAAGVVVRRRNLVAASGKGAPSKRTPGVPEDPVSLAVQPERTG